ncbi:hypothetical protein SCAR479_13752 [Seiridium cardinale]|uniref:NmrA-like domain-containing protein n=1 Tax=Seiridium cardinale TaxID=138064 RepID=A0ABR2X7I0_9PEZI
MVAVFIAGATGKQGGGTARTLLSMGHQVHAYVRDTEAPSARSLAQQGAKLFQGDWESLPAIRAAVKGCAAVFFPSMPSFTDPAAEERWAANILSAARDSGSVKHVVYSTSAVLERFDKIKAVEGWDDNAFMAQYFWSKNAGEKAVRDWARVGEGLKYTILRPSGFMSNWLEPVASFQIPDLISEGVWHTVFPPDFPIAQIAPGDIGRVAALAIENPEKWHGKEAELTTERMPVKEVLELLSEFSGKDLKPHSYTKEEGEEVAKVNPIIKGGVLTMKTQPADGPVVGDLDVPFRPQTFREYLEENKSVVVETYKNVAARA